MTLTQPWIIQKVNYLSKTLNDQKLKARFYSCLIIFTLCCVCINMNAQSDTVKVQSKATKKAIYGEARKASIMSAVLPGLGQAYNRKFWKLPILYAGLGGFGYLFYVNQQKFKYFSDNLRWENDSDPETLNNTDPLLNSDQLLSEKTLYRKRRDIGVIGIAIFYFVNIIDANVDAHLKTFDVSDDLSLKIKPYSNFTYSGSNKPVLHNGICLQLNFK